MRRPRLPIALAFVVVLAAACGSSWTTYRSEAGRYEILLPEGKRSEREVKDTRRTVHLLQVDVTDNAGYGVAYWDLADTEGKSAADLMLEAQRKILSDVGGSVAEASAIALGDVPGRAFKGNLPNGVHLAVRLYATGDKPLRFYQLIAAVRDPRARDGDMRKFFDSFRILK